MLLKSFNNIFLNIFNNIISILLKTKYGVKRGERINLKKKIERY